MSAILQASEERATVIPCDESNLFCKLPRDVIHLITSFLWEGINEFTEDDASMERSIRVYNFQRTCKFLYNTATVPGAQYRVSPSLRDFPQEQPQLFIQSLRRCLKRILDQQGNNSIIVEICGHDYGGQPNRQLDIEAFFNTCADPLFAPHIKGIQLSDTPIDRIPATIQRMPDLRCVELSANGPTFKLDKDTIMTLAKIRSLKSLLITDNNLTSLDPSITQLSHRIDDEQYIDAGLAQYAILESLDLSDNKLCPKDLALLNNLPIKELNISGNNCTYEDVLKKLTDYKMFFPHRKIFADNLRITKDFASTIKILRITDPSDYLARKAYMEDHRVELIATKFQ
jgi:hypothetical protein